MTAARLTPVLAALLLLAITIPPAASGADGLFLTWHDCPAGAGAAHDLQWDCGSNAGAEDLLCAFQVAAPVDSVLGVEVVVDLQHAAPTLPDWWHFEPGGCRVGALSAAFDFPATVCADLLHGDAAGALQDYTVGRPRGGDNQAEIRAAAALLPSAGYATLDPALVYGAARIRISNVSTTGPVCSGCSGSACLVLNSVRVLRQPGAIGGDLLLATPGSGNANWATWQGGTGADCTAVPVRAMTWGQVKGLYR